MKRKPNRRLPSPDPFGLEGLNLTRDSICERQIPEWFDEMRATLEERWRTVEDYRARSVLAAKLEEELARPFTASEARKWFEDARQDHLWRLRLLDGKTKEGKLYQDYAALGLHNDFFRPDPGAMPKMRKLLLFLLDLHEPPYALYPPTLSQPTRVSGDYVMVKIRGTPQLVQFPLEGVTIPRRFSKARAHRLVANFLRVRSREYWRLALDQLRSAVANPVRPYARLKKAGLLEIALDLASVNLAAAIQDPMLRPFESPPRRASTITASQLRQAARLLGEWYPLVKRYLRSANRTAVAKTMPAGFHGRIRAAHEKEPQAKRIALQMVLDEMALPIGVDTLQRRLRPYLPEPGRRT